MTNQYGQILVVEHKCENTDCDVILQRRPSDIRRKHRRYCSVACKKHIGVQPRKYTEEEMAWIKQHLNVLPTKDIAKRYNVSPETFRKALSYLRDKDPAIPHIIRVQPKRKPEVKKDANKLAPKKHLHKSLKSKPMRKQTIYSSNHGKPPKPERREMKIKAPPLGTPGYIMVKLNDKTYAQKKIA